jgi:hypothetical protein
MTQEVKTTREEIYESVLQEYREMIRSSGDFAEIKTTSLKLLKHHPLPRTIFVLKSIPVATIKGAADFR